jgi:hypothetical protein
MSQRIKLVRGDNRPYIRLALKDVDGDPINLADSDVRVYFRAAGATSILSTITCTITDAANGEVVFNFPGNTLDVEPGPYEGEVEVDFGGEIQTVYQVLKFNVRDQFA